jgi:hypothetical protein
MNIQLQIEERPGYLLARFTGDGEVADICKKFSLIAERCKDANIHRLLLDWVGPYEDASVWESYLLGKGAQIFIPYRLKIASVSQSTDLDPQNLGLGELVARNRGVDVRAFTDIKEAEEWLLEQEPS